MKALTSLRAHLLNAGIIMVQQNENLIDIVWSKDRPAAPSQNVWEME